MRRILLVVLWQFGLLSGNLLFADVVTLKDGRQISGALESGNIQELHLKSGEQSQTIDIHDVQAIQLGVSLPPQAAPSAAKAADADQPAPAQPNNLILNDGTHVAGRLWSIDATTLHFLVNNQLQHYPRRDVTGVTFGNASLPPPPARSSPSPAVSAPPPTTAAAPDRAPTLKRSSDAPTLKRASDTPVPQQPPTLKRPSEGAPAAAPQQGLSQPEEIGTVYFWNGKFLTPLETTQAVARKSGNTEYFEIPAERSRVRLSADASFIFILRLPKGVDPNYSLFPLVTANGSRRTQSQPGRRGGLTTWPVHIEINDDSSLITYSLTVKDLPAGEYSFSPSSSNDAYCFGVDPASGQ